MTCSWRRAPSAWRRRTERSAFPWQRSSNLGRRSAGKLLDSGKDKSKSKILVLQIVCWKKSVG